MSQLLCTFSNTNDYESTLIKITNTYDIIFNKIYVLSNVEDPYYLYLTYNTGGDRYSEYLPKTISVHRKRQTNTLYTINALNELIKYLNNGIQDNSFQVDWDDYQNCIILTSDDGYRILDTELYKIVNL